MGVRDNGVKHTLVWCYREVVLSKHTEKGRGNGSSTCKYLAVIKEVCPGYLTPKSWGRASPSKGMI